MWTISLTKNTVKIPKKCAKELWTKIGDTYFCSEDNVIDQNGYLRFNPDHYEHMNYLNDDQVIDILLKYPLEGDICFAYFNGDDIGKMWGYRFTNKTMIPLKGEIVYTPKI